MQVNGALGEALARIQRLQRMRRSESTDLPIPDEPSCPVGECDGSGWVWVGDSNKVRICKCEVQRQSRLRLKRLFGQASIPPLYAGLTLDKLDNRHPGAIRAARRFVEQWLEIRRAGRWLYLHGPVGAGKTALAYAILQELLGKGVAGIADTVPDLMDQLRPGRDDQAWERMEALRGAELLVLDDLGAQRNTEWVTETLFRLLNHRSRALLPTIITSNDSLGQLLQLGRGTVEWERIVDRIAEMAEIVQLSGPSRRLEIARQRKGGDGRVT